MAAWMRCAGHGRLGRLAMRMAAIAAPPHRARNILARMSPAGFVSSSVVEYHPRLNVGAHVFIGERVVLFSRDGTGQIALGDGVHLYQDSFLETGQEGEIRIGARTSIHSRCQLMAYVGSIRIGEGVAIAAGCALYPYDHGTALGQPIGRQPLVSKGDIVIDDDAWLGTGVIVLAGVRIGSGAVVAAGTVVTRDIPADAIAAGVPARVVGTRRSPADRPGSTPLARAVP
jgi:acetyltransferase-like isoleucine patch superfamily enzyme